MWQPQNSKLMLGLLSSYSSSSPLTVFSVTPEDFSGLFSVAALDFGTSFA